MLVTSETHQTSLDENDVQSPVTKSGSNIKLFKDRALNNFIKNHIRGTKKDIAE